MSTIRDQSDNDVSTLLDPSTEPPDWSILTESISYTSPPIADIRVAASQPPVNDAPLNRHSPTCGPLTPPIDLHLFQPYEGVQACLSTTASHDESTDVSTTFIGLVSEPANNPAYQSEHSFPFDTCSCIKASLPNGETFNMLLDTGAS